MSFPDSSDDLSVLLGGFTKASEDKIKNNNMQMKHLMDSFEAQRERKMAKKKIDEENGTKMNLKKK